ncbi:MAG: DNA polymerase III subunit alpha [Propionibacteriaceae bacterium]|nr:DNA polymerase III subunit alpha [Propionibacteriaceae bacterium]
MEPFTHLHVASCFSAHHGTAWPEALVDASRDAPAAALTDKDGLYGAVRHIRACLAAGIQPIVGADLLTNGGAEITVLAHGRNQGQGWACLCRLISAAHAGTSATGTSATTSSALPRDTSTNRAAMITADRIQGILTGGGDIPVTVLLGPGSSVGRAVLAGDASRARALLASWAGLLPGAVAVEIVCHYAKPGEPASVPHAAAMLALAREAGVPAVLTNAVRYLDPADAVTADVLDAAGLLLPLGAFQPQPNAEAWLKPARLMRQVGADVCAHADQGDDALSRLLDDTEALAQRCGLDADADLRWRVAKTPELDVIGINDDPLDVLTHRCRSALPDRYPSPSAHMKHLLMSRLDDELHVIAGFGFSSYFLVVADIADMIRQMGVRVQARGSGAGSLVNYLLGVSQADPIEHNLLFERFLGSARSTLPDIDLDVESARRHDIDRAVAKRYGPHRTVLLSMRNQYRARSAVRDAGLALGLPDEDVDRFAKSLWRLNAHDISRALTERPELDAVAREASVDPRLRVLVDLAERLDRLPRHVSMHPCGVIVSDENLLSTTPTQPSGLGLAMSQYDKDDVDDMGLLKLDILGVRMQSAMAYALEQIQAATGERIDLDAIPHDDPATFEAIRSTHTLGMFQIESPGQRELIGKLQPETMTDLVADISLFRPGPMKGNMITPFLDSRLGFRSQAALHPRFREFLADAHQVVIFHEHVLRILSDCMGVTLAEADEIRRHLGEDAEAIEAAFRSRAAQRMDQGRRLFSDVQIEKIWTVLREFGSFGFCKAHAVAFALTTYQSAWLKTHHTAGFMCGLLEHDPGMYPQRLLAAEAKRLGIPLLGVDANASSASFRLEPTPNGLGIRIPFTQLSGISGAEARRLATHQPYSSLSDLLERARPHRPTALKLAAVGAFDQLCPRHERGAVIALTRRMTAARVAVPEDQDPLPQWDEGDETSDVPGPGRGYEPNAWDEARTDPTSLATETSLLGLEVSGHLLDPWKEGLDEMGVTRADQLLAVRNHSRVLVAGVRVATQTPPMRSGRRVVFLSLDDGTGVVDCAFFPDSQHEVGLDLFHARVLAVRGYTRRTGARGVSITADEAWALPAAA